MFCEGKTKRKKLEKLANFGLCWYSLLLLLQLNFLVCQILGLVLAVPFRTILSPKNTSPQVRLMVELVVGLALTVFCFGQ